MASSKFKQILAGGLAAVMILGSTGAGIALALSSRIKAFGEMSRAYRAQEEAFLKAEDAGADWLEDEPNSGPKAILKRLPEPENTWQLNKTDAYGDWQAPDFKISDLKYEHYELSRFQAACDTFLEKIGLSRAAMDAEPAADLSEAELSAALDAILKEYDHVSTLSSFNQFQYTQNVKDKKVKEEMTYMENLSSDVFNELLETLQGVQKNAVAGPILEAVLGEEKAADLAESEVLTKRQKAIKEEENRLEQDFDNLPERGQNEQKGEIYLKLLQLRNEFAREEGYKNYREMDEAESYGRDFDDEDMQKYFAAVKKYIAPLYMALAMRVSWPAIDAYEYPQGHSLEELIGSHIGNISSELLESYNYLLDNQLFVLGDSPDNEDVSYTINVPDYKSALIFIKDDGDYHNLSTLTHEFGHFNTAVRAKGDSFFSHSNIDLAEIHSQGLELLFLAYANELYGSTAKDARMMILLNMVWAVLTGCLYHEFEIYAHSTPNVTLEQLRSKYVEIADEYLPGMNGEDDWMFWHIYHAPFYYISYSLSAMASLTLLPGMREDWRGTVNNYLKLTALGEDSYPFRETLKQSNLPDIFENATIQNVAREINRWLDDPFVLTPAIGNEGQQKPGEPAVSEPRPSISLPEYGSETLPPATDQPAADQPGSSSENPDTKGYSSEKFWEGNPETGFFRKFAELPKAFLYILTGDVWTDIFRALQSLQPEAFSAYEAVPAPVPSPSLPSDPAAAAGRTGAVVPPSRR